MPKLIVNNDIEMLNMLIEVLILVELLVLNQDSLLDKSEDLGWVHLSNVHPFHKV